MTWAHTQRGKGASSIQTLPNKPTNKSYIYSFLIVTFIFNIISSALTLHTATALCKIDLGSVFSQVIRYTVQLLPSIDNQSIFPLTCSFQVLDEWGQMNAKSKFDPLRKRKIPSKRRWGTPEIHEKVTYKVKSNQ